MASTFTFEEAQDAGTSFTFEEAMTPASPSDARRVDNAIDSKVEAEANAEPQKVVTSARAWNGAGAGRGGISDPRRLDIKENADRIAEENFINKRVEKLRKINPSATEQSLRQMAASEYNPDAVAQDAPKSAEEERSMRVSSLTDKGYEEANAKAKAAFDMRFNANQAKKDTDPNGEKVALGIDQGEQNSQAYMDAAREKVIQNAKDDRIKEMANDTPLSSAFGVGLAKSAIGLSNLPQAIINAPIEIVNKIGGGLTDGKVNIPTLPKWGFTKDAIEFMNKWMPDAASKDLTDAWSDGTFGPTLLTKLSANSPSTALSMLAMFAPPLRAVLLPMMGGMTTGQSYTEGSSAVGSVLQGGAEVLGEKLPLGVFDKTVEKVAAIPLPLRDKFMQVVGQKILKSGTVVTVTGLTNFIEEAATQVMQNAIDINVDGQKKSYTDGAIDAGIVGLAQGGGMSMPHAASILAGPGSKEALINRELSSQLTEGKFAPVGEDGPRIANTNPNLARPTPADVLSAPNNIDTIVATATASVKPVDLSSVQETIDGAARNIQPGIAGDGGAGANVAAPSVDAGVGSAGAVGGTLDTGGAADTATGADASVGASDQTPVGVRQKSADGWEYTLDEGGKVTIHGDAKAIRAAFPGDRSTAVADGVLFGKTRTADVLSKLGAATGVANGKQNVGMPVERSDGAVAGGAGVLREKADAAGLAGVDSDEAQFRSDAQSRLDAERARNPNAPKVTLNKASDAEVAQLSGALEQTSQLFGATPDIQFFSDSDKESANGFHDPVTDTVWVNTSGLTYNAAGTGWHETHHVLQSIAEANDKQEAEAAARGEKWTKTKYQNYRDKVDGIYNTMSLKGRAAYAGNFLYANEVNAMPEVQSLLNGRDESDLSVDENKALTDLRTRLGKKFMSRPKLQREMMADFIGNRANDKEFIKGMAEADPKNFAEWAKQWLNTIANLLESLKGNGKNTYSEGVDKIVRNLEESRKIVQDALVELKNAEGSATKTTGTDTSFQAREAAPSGRRFVSVDEFDGGPDNTDELGAFDIDRKYAESTKTEDIDLDNLIDKPVSAEDKAEIQRELNARSAPSEAVTVEQMAEHGLFPERAFPFGEVKETSDGLSIETPADLEAYKVIKTGDDQYRINSGTDTGWFSNGSSYTKDVAVNLYKAHLTRGLIHRAKYDIASAYKKGTALKIASAWMELAKARNAFKTKGKSSSTNFVQIAKDMDAFAGYAVSNESNDIRNTNLHFKDKATGQDFSANTHWSELSDDDGFAINTMRMKGSRAGSELYAVVAQWAKNLNEKFYCDTLISAVNTFRRTEQAFSFAIKTGDTGTLLPGLQNRVYGFNEDPVTKEDHMMNIARLALAGMRNMMEVMPDTTLPANGSHTVKYDPATGKFTNEKGEQTMIGLTRLSYDPETSTFKDQSGRDVTKGIKLWVEDPKNRGTGVGMSTIARAVLTNGIIMGKVDVDEVDAFAQPIAYQRKQIDILNVEDAENVAEKSVYTKEQKAKALEEKFKRMRDFHNDRDSLMERINKDADAGKEEAVVLRMIAQTGFRVGGGVTDGQPTYAATTLKSSHVKVRGDTVSFDFVGKAGVRQRHGITDTKIAKDIKARLGREKLFNTTDRAVRRYKDSITGDKPYKVHDFRTWIATQEARDFVADAPQPENLEEFRKGVEWALSIAATKIGDTLETTKEHYVDPEIFEGWRKSAGIKDQAGVLEGIGEGEAELNEAQDGSATQGDDEQAVRGAKDSEVSYQRREPKEDTSVTRWARKIFDGTGDIAESKVIADSLPHASMSMASIGPFGDKQIVVVDGHALQHASKHKTDGITPEIIGMIPDALKQPRMVTFQAPGQLMAMLPVRNAAGDPVVVIMKKGEISAGHQTLKLTRFATTYPLTNSAQYLAKEIKKGNRVWLPFEEVSRLRELLAGANFPSDQNGPSQTLALPASRGRSQAAKTYTVLSDEALVKKQAGDKDWAKAQEPIEIPDDSDRILKGIAFSRKQIVGQTKRQYTARQLRGLDNIGARKDLPSIKDRAKALWKDAGKKMAQGIADQFAPIAEFDKVAYGLMRLAKGASGAFETLLQGGMLKLTNNAYDFDEAKRGGVIQRLLMPLQGEHHDFLRWIAANRAERLLAEDRERLFTRQTIEDLKTLADGTTDFDYTIQHGPMAGTVTRDRTTIYKDSLITFNEFNKNVLDLAEQSGLIDPESRQFWEHEFYVPFYRVSDEEGFAGAQVKKGAVRQQAFKELKGGADKLNADLLDNTLMNWAHLLDASAKNRAALASLDAAVDMGIAIESNESSLRDMAASIRKKNGVVWVMDEGKQRFFLVDDPYVLTALQGLEYAGMKGMVWDVLSAPKHWLTVGVTASPFFKIRNLIRDSVQAISVGELSYNPIKNIAQGFALSNPESDSHFRMLAGGGTIHFATMYEGSEAKRVQALVESGVKDFTILNDPIKVKAFYRKFVEPAITAYNELGNRGEEVNRAALYNQLIKQGVSHADAALQARDLMDFSMQGSWVTIRALTQVVPFMNARIQGMYKLGKGAKENPARFAAVTGMVALASLSLLAAYHDDDDWKQREEWDRNNFWWFKFGGVAFRIPKPFEVGAIGTLAERGFEWMFEKEMTNKRFMTQVKDLFVDNLSMTIIPQAIKPIQDIYSNKDSFSGRPIENSAVEKLDPQYRFNQNTSMAARGASTAMTKVMGNAALSPLQIDHMLRGYFGWLGTFVVSSGDLIARQVANEPTKPTPDYWKVATGGMIADKDSGQSRYVSQMYEQAKELERAYATHRDLLKKGKSEEAKEYRQENAEKLKLYGRVEGVKKTVGAMNERIRMIERSSKTADEKRDAIQKIKEQQDKLARQLVPH